MFIIYRIKRFSMFVHDSLFRITGKLKLKIEKKKNDQIRSLGRIINFH